MLHAALGAQHTWRMATMRGLHARRDLSVWVASCSVNPRHQNMYASAVAGARPRPARSMRQTQDMRSGMPRETRTGGGTRPHPQASGLLSITLKHLARTLLLAACRHGHSHTTSM